jgi:hypothetical protein
MNTFRRMSPFVVLPMVTFMWLCAVSSVAADDDIRLVEGAMILAPTGKLASMGNASDDTLTACLTRIPAQISPQQRLTAQSVCQQEEATRQVVPLVRKEGD